MAGKLSPKGVTILEVDREGRVIESISGYGQGWRALRPEKAHCGSPEWMFQVVLAPDPDSLQRVIQDVTATGVFTGHIMSSGTSCTTCKGAVYINPDGPIHPKPGDDRYYVLLQGNWADRSTGAPRSGPAAGTEYVASTVIISHHEIQNIPAFKASWELLTEQALEFFQLEELASKKDPGYKE